MHPVCTRAVVIAIALFTIPAIASPVPGAIFTTDRDGDLVNGNIYDDCCDVFLNGGPPAHAPCTSAGLPDGDYYFQVTDPSGSVLLSCDPISQRRVRVAGGVIDWYYGVSMPCSDCASGTPAGHELGMGKCFSTIGTNLSVQLMPFNPTPNPGGEYKAWMTPVHFFDAASAGTYGGGTYWGFVEHDSKTDNFKCRDSVSPPNLEISCPIDFEVCNDQGQCGANVAYATPIVAGGTEPYIVDCVPASGSFFQVGVTVVNCTVTDSGNPPQTAQCSFNVTVTDCEGPELTGCDDINVCNDAASCDAIVQFAVVATDACEGFIIPTCDATPGSAFPVGTTTVNCSAVDSLGNVTQCSFDITVDDCDAPSLVCPGDIQVCNDAGACGAAVAFSVSAVDVCEGGIAPSCDASSGDFFPVGVTAVNCTATDSAGNTGNCSFNITVDDCEDPVLNCPNIQVCNDTDACGASVTFSISGQDNCGGSIPASCDASSGFFAVGTHTVNCTATDAAGNSSNCSFDIIVDDCQAPDIVCPGPITVCNDAGQCGAVATFSVTAADQCDGPVTPSCDATSGDVFPVGTTTVNCSATDASGNTSNCSFDIIVNDCEAPVINCQDVNVCNDAGACGANVAFNVTGTDNCDATVQVNCSPASGSFFTVGTTVVNCDATDAAGNTGTCSFDVTVDDCDAPVLDCQNIGSCNEAGLCGAVATFSVTATDNCDAPFAASCDATSGDFFPVGVTTVNCSATDSAGNTGVCSFDITITDCEAPTIVCPQDVDSCLTAVGGTTLDPGFPTAADNCTAPGAIVIDCVRSDGAGLGSPYPLGTTSISCTATDEAGNVGGPCGWDVNITGSTICASKFFDANADGVFGGAGDVYLSGWQIIVTGTDSTGGAVGPIVGYTDASGNVCFNDLPLGDLIVTEGTSIVGTWRPTTPPSVNLTVDQCSTPLSATFGNICGTPFTGGHTLGFWQNRNGERKLSRIDPAWRHLLNAECLVDESGADFDIDTMVNFGAAYGPFETWLLDGRAVNMAYMLSVQLAATMLSDTVFGLGSGTILLNPEDAACYGSPLADLGTVIAEAQAALCADNLTLSGDPNRAIQECYKDIMDSVVNNEPIFVSPTPCAYGF